MLLERVSRLVPQLEGCLVVEREGHETKEKRKKKEEQEEGKKSTRTREDGHSITEVRPVPNVAPKGPLRCSRWLRVWKVTRRNGLCERSPTAPLQL